MLRLKTTTVAGEVFYGPFVYPFKSEKAKKLKLARLDWQIPRYKEGKKKGQPRGQAKMELVEVKKWPRRSIFNGGSIIWDFEDLIIPFIRTLEHDWEEIECKQLQKEH